MPEARVIPLRPDDDPPPSTPSAPSWDEQVAGGLEFLRRRLTGEYDTDEFGFDPDLTDPTAVAQLLRPRDPGRFDAYPVDRAVGSARANGAELLRQLGRDELHGVVDPVTGEIIGG